MQWGSRTSSKEDAHPHRAERNLVILDYPANDEGVWGHLFENNSPSEPGFANSQVSRRKCENDQRVRRSAAARLAKGLLRRQPRPALA